jgi:hypothetical protein
MKALRLFAAAIVFMFVISLNSFGYSVLCQSVAKSVTTGEAVVTLVSCAIPANAVGVGKSIRVTASFHSVNGSNMDTSVYFNGNEVFSTLAETGPNVQHSYSFIVVNDSNSGGWDVGGTETANETTLAIGPYTSSPGFHGTLPWTTGWTLAFKVAFDCGCNQTFQAQSDIFVVEILN